MKEKSDSKKCKYCGSSIGRKSTGDSKSKAIQSKLGDKNANSYKGSEVNG